MYFFETYRTAITAIFSNKVRSFLTMLGVIIGVMAVVLLISIGKGVQNYITDQFEALGSNLIFVSPGSEAFGQDPAAAFSRNKLQDKHVELIQRYAGDVVDNVTPYVVTSVSFIYKTKSFSGTINAGNELSLKVYNFEVAEGRFYTRSEVRSKSKVIVLGPDVVKELFSTEPAIGKKVKIDNDSYEVVGILKPKGQNYDNGAIAPHTSIMETFNIRNFSNIVVKSKSGVEMSDSIRLIERALRRDLDEDEFNILSQQDILSSIQNILQMLTIGLGAIAAISLVVGGIGIMNIMLVSVTERTREIGLRKAIGATPNEIALQFLFEAVILSVTGGTIGLLLGWLGSLIGRAYIRTEVPWWAVLLAFSFAAVVGIIFGTYPAIKASKKDPIEALRYE